MKRNLEDRKEFIKGEKRCFKCLRTGHVSKDCTQPHTCTQCKGHHPSCLHDNNFKGIMDRSRRATQTQRNVNPEFAKATTAHKTTSNLESAHSSITLPVWLSSKHDPNNEKLVYALIDSESDTTFVDQSIAAQLYSPSKENTRIKIGTLNGQQEKGIPCERINDLQVRSYTGNTYVELPAVYTVNDIPLMTETIPTCDIANNWPHLKNIAKELPPLLNCEPGLLIGFNCSQAFLPRECIAGANLEPFAIKTDLGWGIIGKRTPSNKESQIEKETKPSHLHLSTCNRITSKEIPLSPNDICQILERDFQFDKRETKTISQEDLRFLNILKEGIKKDEDNYKMPLPFKHQSPKLPNNYNLAATRLKHLKQKLSKNNSYYKDYCQFMDTMIERGDAEEVTEESGQECNTQWYIPHHGVYHPQKRKLRVVFDCSARFQQTSLNDHLLTGPNLTNNLIGVLMRFRRHPFALTCDVEKMFHQFKVNEEHKDFLRFLWWKNNDMNNEPSIYRMTVHLFGATSSPGCANFGLKHLAKENNIKYPMGSKFVQNEFYVDDGLSSRATEEELIQLASEATSLCKLGGLRLHKFASNSRTVMDSIPASERDINSQTTNLNFDESSSEKTLGLQWCTGNDRLSFEFSPPERPCTRRGILATVASLYDPLGLIAPYILTGKRVLQDCCQAGTKWDDPLPQKLVPIWMAWKDDFNKLKELIIPRCYHPTNFGPIIKTQLHHFSDASQKGYGMCSYLRMENAKGQIHCSLIVGKARVAPKKIVSIPRLELTAALVAAEIGFAVKEELQLQIDEEFYWTDSQVVLGYINNEARKFHVFVANRVQRIRELTDPKQWHYTTTGANPADHASRGLSLREIQDSNWFTGPLFLWNRKLRIPLTPIPELKPEDPDVRATSLRTHTIPFTPDLDSRLARFSSWKLATHVIARILRLLKDTRKKINSPEVSLEEISHAKSVIISNIQSQFFPEEMARASKGCTLPTTSTLQHAEPFLNDGLLRVGGRLRRSSLPQAEKHPVILPKNSNVTKLIIAHCHEKVKHQGRGMTMNEIRQQGYWIVGGSKLVANYIKKCVTCRKLRGSTQEQLMADLPQERVEPTAPFTHTGMDCFGPIMVKNGRKEVKRYAVLFTCFCSRAIHLEVLDEMSTDAFINALRCFIAIRGTVRQLHCDQGSNFIGASNELRDKTRNFLLEKQCEFTFNAPSASHTGGLWERQIRTVKSVLNATLALCPGRLDDPSLRTLLYETMSIVNSRPLTVICQGDPTSPEPLTPNHILTMKSQIPLPPPGHFVKEDIYLKKRWRRVQYLAKQFWSRWKKEYISTIRQRQKWLHPRRNLTVGDIVLIVDDNTPRNQWPLAKVIAAIKSPDGLVRRVSLEVSTRNLNRLGQRQTKVSMLERPVQKLVLILEAGSL